MTPSHSQTRLTRGEQIVKFYLKFLSRDLTFSHVIHNLLHITVAVGYDSLRFSDLLDTW
jgi:hypothetical protein